METLSESIVKCSPTDSFRELIHLWQKQPFTNETELTDFRRLLHPSPEWDIILSLSPYLTFITDVRRQQYAYVSPQVQHVWGYPPTQFRKEGLGFLRNIMHAEDNRCVWERALRVWKLLLDQPPLERPHYRFNSDYRIQRADRNYVHVLEQNAVLQTDSRGNIIYLISVVSDITDWKQGDKMVASILSTCPQARPVHISPERHLRPVAHLSKRECEIVQLMAQGLSSKLIADQLNLSVHTINTHRKKVIDRTQSKNTGGLIQFAIRNGLI